jgi:hypothetical protein
MHFICYNCAKEAFGPETVAEYASTWGVLVTAPLPRSAGGAPRGPRINKLARCNGCQIAFQVSDLSGKRPDDDEFEREKKERKRLSAM